MSLNISNNIKIVIAKEISKTRVVEILPEEVSLEDFTRVVKNYFKQFKYIPSEWLEPASKYNINYK